ncbi:hypothetical protein BD626DRAFT_407616 [Schizophyllum amplum]|uniref:Uncharacterized protein n=1 Tax=Schizophyllum amplum TaxID=97359 RepID=A0A550C6G8_9AGAR|nr:hypothetical protein BD626DRAFT_407616 [Auriculariopsis ampla]
MGLPMGLGGREKEGRDRSTSGAQAPQPPAHIGSRVAAQIHAMESAVYRGEAQDGQDGIHYSPDTVQYYPTQSLPGIKYSPRHAVSRSRSGLSIDTAHSAGSSVESWQDSRRYGSREELFRQNNKDDMLRVVNR